MMLSQKSTASVVNHARPIQRRVSVVVRAAAGESPELLAKDKLIRAVAKKAGVTQITANKVYFALFEEIGEAVASGQKVVVKNFGTFKSKDRKEREAYSLSEDKIVTQPARKIPMLKVATALRDKVASAPPPPAKFVRQAAAPAAKALAAKAPAAKAPAPAKPAPAASPAKPAARPSAAARPPPRKQA